VSELNYAVIFSFGAVSKLKGLVFLNPEQLYTFCILVANKLLVRVGK